MQHEYDAEDADEAHAEPENERYGKGELGKKDDGIQYVQIRKIDSGNEFAMKLEGRTARHLFGPVLQTAGHRQRQLPQHSLKPHSTHEYANEPGAEMRPRALRWVLPPIPDRDHDACDDEGQKQRDEKIFPRAEGVLIVSVPDHEIPKIRERIRHIRHGISPVVPARTREFLQPRRRQTRGQPGGPGQPYTVT